MLVTRNVVWLVWASALCSVSALCWAESHPATDEKGPVQAPLSINFRPPSPLEFDDHAGYVSIFDGQSLKNWDGDPAVWHVENGAIVGISTKEHPTSNTYIVYRGFEAKDFDLKLEIKVEGNGGSGIQYRSRTGVPWRIDEPNLPSNLNWLLTGPQADIWAPVSVLTSIFTGQFYSENTPQGIVAWRGQVVNSSPGQWPRLVGNIGDRLALGGYVRNNAWNEYLIMARGGTFIHVMNGQLMAVYVDDDPASSNNQPGFVGIELEGAPAKVSVRNVWIKKLPLSVPFLPAPSAAVGDSLAGRWKVDLQLNGIESGDPQMCTFVVKQKKVTGSCSTDQGSHDLTGDVDGKSVTWRMNSGLFGEAVFTGSVDSNSFMTGVFKLKRGVILADFAFTARRVE
jgi:Domain of Unknown Function (DUF1080)